MLKFVINYILTKYPRFYTALDMARHYSSFFAYCYHMIFKKPYFGFYMGSHQVWPTRAPFMRCLMEKICAECESLNMLEIGSWAGESAVLWADIAKGKYAIEKPPEIRIICVDPWRFYPALKANPRLWAMEKASRSDKIFSLFLHNIKYSGHSDVIIPLRTQSQVAAGFFCKGLFDMVFIDGDHSYSSVAFDIRNYAPLLKDGGYICGDDLEVQMSQGIDEAFARENCSQDVIRDPKTGEWLHPGITLAVGEFFGEVSVYSGFWVMQKVGVSWRKVELSTE